MLVYVLGAAAVAIAGLYLAFRRRGQQLQKANVAIQVATNAAAIAATATQITDLETQKSSEHETYEQLQARLDAITNGTPPAGG